MTDTATMTTSTADKLWAALQQAPGTTSKELAASAGIGGSTARKLLVALGRTGGAYRTAGDADGSAQRPADRWWPHIAAADWWVSYDRVMARLAAVAALTRYLETNPDVHE
ncbi:hypothetical protein [Nocardia transvalensis]|uniref:hypothetical protein n=1 Tax=Nocardia transvalensis TaxID=37333 RepID=UPI00189490EE|nr:hypothetical protein [Nocardia transvalensis]MBF6328468.1 hypothetical protein [Nocardia transvalensis]